MKNLSYRYIIVPLQDSVLRGKGEDFFCNWISEITIIFLNATNWIPYDISEYLWIYWKSIAFCKTYSSRSKCEQCTTGECEVVSWIKSVPKCWKCVSKKSFIGSCSLISNRSQPLVCALVPGLNRLLETQWSLKSHRSINFMTIECAWRSIS